jgi:diadenosine tetraphosphatase ApaH/serine/threonine PP2A family protein phosphatase
VFPQIPLAARIDDSILCVHGGIGPKITALNSIAYISRPIAEFGNDIVDSLVWSDPNANVARFEESSARGAGYLFGEEALKKFLADAKLDLLVRAHECVAEGAKEMFDGKVVTVFSASNYCGLMGNQAAVLEVKGPGVRQIKTFPPLQWLLRSSALFGNDLIKPKTAREGSRLGKKGALGIPKGLIRQGSDSVLPIITQKGIGLDESKSMGSFPRLGAELGVATLIQMPFLGQTTQIRTLKPTGRGRRFSTTA